MGDPTTMLPRPAQAQNVYKFALIITGEVIATNESHAEKLIMGGVSTDMNLSVEDLELTLSETKDETPT